MNSIKRSLNLRQALIQVIVFGVFSVGIYRFVENRLLAEFDRGLQTLADAGTGTVEIEWKKKKKYFKVEAEDDHAPAYDADSTLMLVQDPKGKVFFNPEKVDLTSWTSPAVPAAGFLKGDITLPDGRSARYRTQRFIPKIEDEGPVKYSEGEWIVTVVRERISIDDALLKILYGCLGLGIVAILLSFLANYFSVRTGLKPLEEIGKEVTALNTTSLDHRFETASLPQELQPITSKLNEMLERMSVAFEREQRFTSNAAHELRTPLAELQAILQTGQKWRPEDLENDNPSDYFSDGTDVTKRMSRLLETLFTLSRESPESPESLDSEKTEFCLTNSFSDQLASHPQAERIQLEASPSVPVIADRELLTATFANLLGNAISHSTGPVSIELSEDAKSASFLITNSAPDLTQEDMQHLREPFWRKERSRNDQDHLGLGLNLVENFCRSQNWTLEFSLTEDGQFCAKVSEIPKATQDPLPPQLGTSSSKTKKSAMPDFLGEPAT